jgi:hypothetical protein
VETFSGPAHYPQATGGAIADDGERPARFNRRQHAYQPFGDLIPFGNLPRQILLRGTAGVSMGLRQVRQRPFGGRRQRRNMVAKPRRLRFEEASGILQQDAGPRQIPSKSAFRVEPVQVTLEDQPVEHPDHPGN